MRVSASSVGINQVINSPYLGHVCVILSRCLYVAIFPVHGHDRLGQFPVNLQERRFVLEGAFTVHAPGGLTLFC